MPIINSEIGRNTIIHHKELVNIYDSIIGRDCNIGAFVEIGGAIIGKQCHIGAHTFICPGVTLKDKVFIGPGVRFSNDKHPPGLLEDFEILQTVVEYAASIGLGAIILPGIKIGRGAVIGAGSVVTRNVRPGAVVRGNPARVIDADY
jgi:acetyltransferase-like isoleucine patch superfamily enzyme